MKSYELIGEVNERHELRVIVPQEISAGPVKVIVEAENIAESQSEEDSLLDLVAQCKMLTGVKDLAHQHDHYLHGTPKKASHN